MQRFTRNAIMIALGATAVSAHALISQNQGRDTAALQKKAARFGARDDYLVQRALCLNDPQLAPNDFSSNITNTLFPLVPGRTLVYEVGTPDGIEHIEYQETNFVRTINGINCREVHDVSSVNGELKEDTLA